MSRTVRDSRIDSRAARLRLTPLREPYWRKIARGRYLGYRRAREGGNWIARFRDHSGQQLFQALGPADDILDANGVSALSFEQAQDRAREWFTQLEDHGTDGRKRGAYTVTDCMADYLEWVKQHRKSHKHLTTYTNAYSRLGKNSHSHNL